MKDADRRGLTRFLRISAPVALVLSLGIFFFGQFVPEDASAEYIYTVEKIFDFGFYPLFFLAVYGFYNAWEPERKRLDEALSRLRARADAFAAPRKTQIAVATLLTLAALLALAVLASGARFVADLFVSLLPYLCLVGLVWAFRLSRPAEPFFSSLLYGTLVWSVLIWTQTNILSWSDAIYGAPIAVFWLVVSAPVALAVWRGRERWRVWSPRGWEWIPTIIAFAALIAALGYPPNNYDVMTYHMPRVAQWLQNHSLAPYPANIDRQIGMAPFNALVVLQSYAPARLDYFVNLGQWFAYIGCVAGVARLSDLFRLPAVAKNAALIFGATLPPAIVQASNTESCLIVSFFVVAMACQCVVWLQEKTPRARVAVLLGLCLGFAILSKGSAYPIAFPFVCLIAWLSLRYPRKNFALGLLAAALIIAVNAPHLCRTFVGEGNIFAGGDRNILMRPTPATFLTNAIYNFVSNQPILLAGPGREILEKFSEKLGIKQDDLEIFPFGGLVMAMPRYTSMDTYAPNIGQSILIIFVFAAAARKKYRAPWPYTFALLGGFVLFCLVLTWHAWVPRIQLPLFFLAAPLAGMWLASLKRERLRKYILGGLCILAIHPTFMSAERPLAPIVFIRSHHARHFLNTSRERLFFNVWRLYDNDYLAAARFLASQKPGLVGVNVGTNGIEYPLWYILNRSDSPPKIVDATPDSREKPPYVFEYVRIEQDEQSPPRVIKNENGESRVVFKAK